MPRWLGHRRAGAQYRSRWESLSTGGGFARKDALPHAPVIILLFLTSFSPPQREQ